MKIRLMSDLHLEFRRMSWPSLGDSDKDTVLVVAGDVDNAKHLPAFLEAWAPEVKDLIFVFGNHDFYGSSWLRAIEKTKKATEHLDNVHILDQETVVIDGVAFIGASLWTDMDNNDSLTMYYAQLSMADYRLIRTGPPNEPYQRRLRGIDTVSLHMRHKEFIFKEIPIQKAAGNKVVVVTHHLPSYLCMSEKWKKYSGASSLNGAFASELFEDIANSEPDYWFFGHTHDSMDVMVHNTRAICNPRGYLPEEPNIDFDPYFEIDI